MGVQNSPRTSTLGRNRSIGGAWSKTAWIPNSYIFQGAGEVEERGGVGVGAAYPTFQNCLNPKFPVFSGMGGR